ncbi:Aste57867_1343 [Aphanomyces stellatus]|uniref:Aste57867_1343 protein n=1 Tax=Aphanomyces stellatus TaxID=120398 RepID=A0A485K5E1_9STRA|nr:hypothetical protein As57867_001342 [Aphanomyces stellatus]VFT78562.1 Aste57867_1343 [Aphanomyces stellatus]
MVDLKAISFVLLVLQNTLGTIVIKYSRASSKYHGTTTVLLYEMLKLILCCGVVVASSGGNVSAAVRAIRVQVLGDTRGYLKMVLLAALYSFQNNVQLLALDHVSASTYAIVYQLKIVTTALFMVILLKRSFHVVQWLAMVVLMLGVVVCSVGNASSSSTDKQQSSAVGVLMVVGLAVNSGVAAAYFESVLKTHKPPAIDHVKKDHVAIDPMWRTNLQLASVSVVVAAVGVVHTALSSSSTFVFFEGYNGYTWGVIGLQACGGLIVSAVVRYSDNVVKNFGTAFSLVLGCLLSNYLFDDRLTPLFFLGVLLVVLSVYVYGDTRLHRSANKKVDGGGALSGRNDGAVSMTPPDEETESLLNQRAQATTTHARSW